VRRVLSSRRSDAGYKLLHLVSLLWHVCVRRCTGRASLVGAQMSIRDFRDNIYTHTRLMALFRDYPGEPVPER